jgi:hypothetical protein
MARRASSVRAVGGVEGAARQAAGAAQRVAGEGAPWLTRAARLGYAARGVVFVTLALIALQAALGRRQTEGQSGALREIAAQPAGQLLLVLIALGLFGYAAWRLLEAARGAEGEGSDAKGLAVRAGHALSGLVYGALGVQAVRLLRGASAGSGDEARAEDWTARLMALPAGRVLVALVGAGVLAYAGRELWRAVQGRVTQHLDLHALSPAARANVTRLGRAGVGARGVVFALTGGFLLLAALRADPGEATGLSGALATLERAPWGPWLLGAVALGLLAFGLFQLVQARYRQLRPVA